MKTASSHPAIARSLPSAARLQLACFAASPASLKAAIDAGADMVRIPLGSALASMQAPKNDRSTHAVRYAHGRGRKLALDLHRTGSVLTWPDFRNAVARAAMQGFDAIVISDVAVGLYSAMQFPGLPLHFVAPPGICARMATLLKVQMNIARVLVPDTISVSELVEITTGSDVEVEILASRSTGAPDAAPPRNDSFTDEWTSAHASCNDPCYSTTGHLALRQLPLMAALGVHAIQAAPLSDMTDDVASTVRPWRTAIDRCAENSKQYASHRDWHSLLGLQPKY